MHRLRNLKIKYYCFVFADTNVACVIPRPISAGAILLGFKKVFVVLVVFSYDRDFFAIKHVTHIGSFRHHKGQDTAPGE